MQSNSIQQENSNMKCIPFYLKEDIERSGDSTHWSCDVYLKVSDEKWEVFNANVINNEVKSIMAMEEITISDGDIDIEQSLESEGYIRFDMYINTPSRPSILLAGSYLNRHLQGLIPSSESKLLIQIKTDVSEVSIKLNEEAQKRYLNALEGIIGSIDISKPTKKSILDVFCYSIKNQDSNMLSILLLHMQSAQEGNKVKYITSNEQNIASESLDKLNQIIKIIRVERYFSYGHAGNTSSWQYLISSLKNEILKKLQTGNVEQKVRFKFNGTTLPNSCFLYKQFQFHTSRIPTWLKKTATEEKYEKLIRTPEGGSKRIVLTLGSSS